nr:MAG TPA: hypothetical protein [Caudoviricetes sp.]
MNSKKALKTGTIRHQLTQVSQELLYKLFLFYIG